MMSRVRQITLVWTKKKNTLSWDDVSFSMLTMVTRLCLHCQLAPPHYCLEALWSISP